MEAVKNWAFSVCCASVFCGILNLLLPEGSTQKIFRAVIYVFFLSVVVSTFSGFDFSDFGFALKDKTEEITLEDNKFSDISGEYIEFEIKSAAMGILESQGIEPEDISLKVNISAEGSIDIIDFTVTLPEGIIPEELSAKIYQKTGIEPEIIISGEN